MPLDRELKRKIARIVLPVLVTMALFAVAAFGIMIPAYRNGLMAQKKEMLAAVTQAGMNVLSFYERQEKSGNMSLHEAQEAARTQLRALRYGPESKDYVWLNDLQPKMIMHPYRPDLDGRDVSGFEDPDGKRLFMEMVQMVKQHGQGYVSYRWQWKDNPDLIAPKLSHVQLFSPWGWIIGTGVYIEDVRREVALVAREAMLVMAAVLAVIFLLSLLIIRRSIRDMMGRRKAERELIAYKDTLEELVAKRTAELQDAMAQVKVLSGFLPICASCKKIRDDDGNWNQIEAYIRDHSEAEFSHGICPDCVKKLYPGVSF